MQLRLSVPHAQSSVAALEQVNDIVESSLLGSDGSAFAFSGFYIDTETDLILMQQVLLDFMYGVIVVFVFRSVCYRT